MNLPWGNYPTIPQMFLPPRTFALGSCALTKTVNKMSREYINIFPGMLTIFRTLKTVSLVK